MSFSVHFVHSVECLRCGHVAKGRDARQMWCRQALHIHRKHGPLEPGGLSIGTWLRLVWGAL